MHQENASVLQYPFLGHPWKTAGSSQHYSFLCQHLGNHTGKPGMGPCTKLEETVPGWLPNPGVLVYICNTAKHWGRPKCLKETGAASPALACRVPAAPHCRKQDSSLPSCHSLQAGSALSSGCCLVSGDPPDSVLREVRAKGKIPFPTAPQVLPELQGVSTPWRKPVLVPQFLYLQEKEHVCMYVCFLPSFLGGMEGYKNH